MIRDIGDSQLEDLLTLESKTIAFGFYLRQACNDGRITQTLLEKYGEMEKYVRLVNKYGKEVYEQKKRDGTLPKEEQSSMKQETISRVVNGIQRPSFQQVSIWIFVIKRHYTSEDVRLMFDNKGLSIPNFTEEMEEKLWISSGYLSPNMVRKAIHDNGMDLVSYPNCVKYINRQELPSERRGEKIQSKKRRDPDTEPLINTRALMAAQDSLKIC